MVNEKLLGFGASQATIYYELALSRGAQVLEKLIPDPGGMIAVVDGWHAYDGFFFRIQLCWSYISRVRTQRGGDSEALLHREVVSLYERRQNNPKVRERWQKLSFSHTGAVVDYPCGSWVCSWTEKLRRASAELFTCMEFPSVPMDNNHAERSLRELVVHRKIRGYISTPVLTDILVFSKSCKLQGKNFGTELRRFLS